jgi:hypothetical protein
MKASTASEGSACVDEENEEEGREGSSASEGEDAPANDGRLMSPSHRTGLAKLPSVVEWLAHALGRCAGYVQYSILVQPVVQWLLGYFMSLSPRNCCLWVRIPSHVVCSEQDRNIGVSS